MASDEPSGSCDECFHGNPKPLKHRGNGGSGGLVKLLLLGVEAARRRCCNSSRVSRLILLFFLFPSGQCGKGGTIFLHDRSSNPELSFCFGKNPRLTLSPATSSRFGVVFSFSLVPHGVNLLSLVGLSAGSCDSDPRCAGDVNNSYSSFSASIPIFFSPAAFFSQYFFTQASQLLPAAGSRSLKASAAISE